MGGEDLGGDEEGETVIRIYCMEKKLFPIKRKKSSFSNSSSASVSYVHSLNVQTLNFKLQG